MLATPFALVVARVRAPAGVHGPPRGRGAAGAAAAELARSPGSSLGSLYAINSLDFPTAIVVGLARAPRLGARGARPWRWALALGRRPGSSRRSSSSCRSGGASRRRRRLGVVGEHDHFSRFAARLRAASTGCRSGSSPRSSPSGSRCRFRYLAWGGVAVMVALVLLSPSAARRPGARARRRRVRALRRARSGPAPPAVPLALAAARRRARPARDRRVRLPPRRVRRHAELPLQHRLQDRLPGLVPARDRRAACARLLERALARAAGCARSWLVGLAGARRARARLSGRGLVLAVGRVRAGSPTLDGHALARATARRATPPRSGGCARTSTARRSCSRRSGADFDPEGRGRVSTFTGLPTRDRLAAGTRCSGATTRATRSADVQRIYRTTDARRRAPAARALRRPLRLRRQPRAARLPGRRALAKFDRLGTVAFRSGETTRLPRSPSRAARLGRRAPVDRARRGCCTRASRSVPRPAAHFAVPSGKYARSSGPTTTYDAP